VRDKKVFVQMSDHHHDDRLGFWCAAPPGVMAELVEQEPERGVVHPMLRVVDMEIADGELQTLTPGRIGGEQVAEMDIGDLRLMGGQRPPLRCAVDGFGDF
jgi:hypothetical protein